MAELSVGWGESPGKHHGHMVKPYSGCTLA